MPKPLTMDQRTALALMKKKAGVEYGTTVGLVWLSRHTPEEFGVKRLLLGMPMILDPDVPEGLIVLGMAGRRQ